MCVCHLVNPWTEFLTPKSSSTRSRWRSEAGSVLVEFSHVPDNSWNTERCAPGDAAHVGRVTRLVTFAVSLRDLRGALSCGLKLEVWVLVWTQIVRRTATVASRRRKGCMPRWTFERSRRDGWFHIRCLRVWSTARTENMLFQLPHVFVAEADPSRFGQGGTPRVAKSLHVCMCLARMRKRTCAMTKSTRLCHVGARFFGCAPPPATVGRHQRCGKTCA